jgi:hypothetical protein
MAVVRKHFELGHKYEPEKELTNEQRQRFSEAANKAEERRKQRELYESLLHPEKTKTTQAARPKSLRQHVKFQITGPRKRRIITLRLMVWLFVLWAFWLWVMFMFPV